MKIRLSIEKRSFEYKLFWVLFLTVLFVILLQNPANAQVNPTVNGTSLTIDVKNSVNLTTVYDAEVTLTSTALPFPFKVKSVNGLYSFTRLPAGDYSFTVSASGYITTTSISVGTLNVNENNSRSVQLIADSSLYGINSVNFYDTNYDKDIIAGTVSWSTYGTIPEGAEVQVQLYDDQNVPVGSPLITYAASNSSYLIPNTNVTSGATRIGVQLIYNSLVIDKKTLTMWGGLFLYPSNLSFTDSNSSRGINATISWSGLADETQIGGYRIYYWLKGPGAWKYWDVVGKRMDKNYQYSFDTIPEGTGAFLLGINNLQGEEQGSYPTLYLYDNRLTDSVLTATYDANLPMISNLIDNTAAYSLHTISGYINWTAPEEISQIQGYALYFSNANGDKVQAIATRYFGGTYNSIDFSLRSINNADLPVPSGATQFALYTVGVDGSESAPTFLPIKAYSNVVNVSGNKLPTNLKFIDLDAQLQKLRGYITWDRAVDESTLSSYLVYYLDSNNQPLSLIGEVAKASSPQLTLPESTVLPAGAAKIGIFIKNLNTSQSSNSIKISLLDNDSEFKVNLAVRQSYFPNITRLGVEHVVSLLNNPTNIITFSNADIGLFLLAIDPINPG